jgi:drug/metabolite transporter (DMT)-like permease
MHWLPITLLCALSLASADAATKAWLRDYSARELALVRFALAGLLLAPGLRLFPLGHPPAVFWLWVTALVPLEILAMLLYMRAIRDHPLSLTLPYLAFTPVLVALTGWLILGERVSLPGLAGVVLVVAGGWLLNLRRARARGWRSWAAPLAAMLHEPGARLMLGVAAIYALTAVLGKGAMGYTTPAAFGPFYFGLLGLATVLLFGSGDPGILRRILRRPLAALTVAALMAIMVASHFLALDQVEVAYMIAVKRTSLLFGMLYGALLFGERHLGTSLAAGALMVLGVFLILL